MIRFLKSVLKGVLIGLIIWCIKGYIVKADSISDLVVTSNSYAQISGQPYYDHFQRYLTSSTDIGIADNGTINYTVVNSNTPSVYARWSICALPNTNLSAPYGNNVTDLSIENTHISCNFNNNVVGFVTFVKFKLSPYGTPSNGAYPFLYFIGIHNSASTSFQTLAVEYSFNQFPIYDTNSYQVQQLDAILNAILTLNANQSVTNAINNQTTTITNSTNAVISNQTNNTNSVNENIDNQFNNCSIIGIGPKDADIKNMQLTSNGRFDTNAPGKGVTKYIPISSFDKQYNGYYNVCFYDNDKVLISCVNVADIPNGLYTLPSGTVYGRFTVDLDTHVGDMFYAKSCPNRLDQTNQSIQEVNDTLKDDNVDDPQDYSSNVASNGVITQLITLPITLFQKLINSTSASCNPFTLGTLYGATLTMPCINLQTYLGSTLYNVIDLLISGLFIYAISRKMVKVFNSLSTMKEGDVVNG